MESMLRFVRRAVSQDKKRLVEGDFDLDLSYICDRVIAMGFPSEGVEGLYRNPIGEVAEFLVRHHHHNFRIFNLTERAYDYTKFDNKVVECGFPDHHGPPLELLIKTCEQIDEFLRESAKNIVVVHCKAGKGRTGTIVASYLMYSGFYDNAADALARFAKFRSHEAIGVGMPSQLRYVRYLDDMLHRGAIPSTQPLILSRLIINTIPRCSPESGARLHIEIFRTAILPSPPELLYTSAATEAERANIKLSYPSDGSVAFLVDRELLGDVYVRGYHYARGKSTMIFRFQLHTGFVDSRAPVYRLSRSDIDEACKDRRFDDDFFVDLMFQIPMSTMSDDLVAGSDDGGASSTAVVPCQIERDEAARGELCFHVGALRLLDLSPESMRDQEKTMVLRKRFEPGSKDGERELHLHEQRVLALCVVGDTVYSAAADNKLIAWSLSRPAEACSVVFEGHTAPVTCLDATADLLCSGGEDAVINLWDPADGTCTSTVAAHDGAVTCLQQYKTLLFSGSYDASVKSWDLTTQETVCMAEYAHDRGVDGLFVSGNSLYTSSIDCIVRCFNIVDRTCTMQFQTFRGKLSHFVVANELLYATEGSIFHCINASCGEVLRSFDFREQILQFAVVDGMVLALFPRCIRAFDIRTGTITSTIPTPKATCLAWASGATLFTGSEAGVVRAVPTDVRTVGVRGGADDS